MELPWRRRTPAGAPPGSPAGSAGSTTPAGELDALRTALADTVIRVNRSAGRLPVGVVPGIRAIEDVLTELLEHAGATAGSSISAAERYALRATITDYLPTSVEAFLALPAEFAAGHRTTTGRTPAQELAEQVRLLDGAVRELALAVYSGDAERLAVQGRFLDTKFSRSDLELA